MIKISRPPNPPRHLLEKGARETEKLCRKVAETGANPGSDDFDDKIYKHKSVREALKKAQSSKCCFCEQSLVHEEYDVEHFRPKSHYYWLVYDWSNLLLACVFCNRRYKRDHFPLSVPENRAGSHLDSLEREEPLFINPAEEDPERFIGFRQWRVIAIQRNERGRETIRKIGLCDPELNDRRQKAYEMLRAMYLALEKLTPEQREQLRKESDTFEVYEGQFRPESEYSAMKRAALQVQFRSPEEL